MDALSPSQDEEEVRDKNSTSVVEVFYHPY